MLLKVAKMLKKKLGPEAIERDWSWIKGLMDCFKIPSSLIIPESVKRTGDYAFDQCWYLRKVEIPRSVEEIGGAAFRGCNLEEVEIPEGCKYIGSNSFCGCIELERVVIPKSVELIGYCAFYDCNATIILQKPRGKFNFIASSAFRGCKDVKEKVRT